jgi:diguanylate cyclase (GGDEF)-like protein
MFVDFSQILIASCAITALQSVVMLVIWLQDRAATWLLWIAAVFLFGGAFLFLFQLDTTPSMRLISIGLGTGVFLVTCFCVWSAARSFEGRDVMWPMPFGALSVWSAYCAMPDALNSLTFASLVQSAMAAICVGAAAFEFWRGRKKQKVMARWGMVGLFGIVAVFFLVRVPLVGLLPFPFGGLATKLEWVATYVLGLAGAAVVLSFISIMLAKERAELELRAYALTDALTGLLNRRAFGLDIAGVARTHEHSGHPYTLVMFDLDHFKDINDSHGHALGDTVLRNFANVARSLLPPDCLYRLGGEEFCCVLRDTRADEAMRLANQVRVAFRSTPIVQAGRGLHVSVSAGIASSTEAGYDPVRVQGVADEALYRAKRLGRDRVAAGAHEPLEDDVAWSVG